MKTCGSGGQRFDPPGRPMGAAIRRSPPVPVHPDAICQSLISGCELIVLNTRTEKPSQTCPCCGTVRKKALAERAHRCGRGFAATRDQAAALAMLAAGLRLTGREPTWARASEPETVHQCRE